MRTLLLAACATILGVQLFLPGFIGLASNGDHGKITGWLSLAPRGGSADEFVFFKPDWVRDRNCYWRSPYISSELGLAWAARALAGATREGAPFDIRWLGLLHAAFFVGAFAVALRCAHPAAAAVALFLLGDVAYVSYFNSFYPDAAALGGLFLMVACAAWIAVTPEPGADRVLLFGLGAIVFVASKGQHGMWAALPVAFACFCARQTRERTVSIGVAAAILASALVVAAWPPKAYRAQALYNLLFYKIADMRDLRELGVRDDEARLTGTHSFLPGSPAADPRWLEPFYERTGYGRVLRWYALHPGRAARFLWRALADDAQTLRAENLSNYPRAAGRPPGARTGRFAWWSRLRSAALRRWPAHLALWYALFLGCCVVKWRKPLAWVAAGVALLGCGEFAVAALADALETNRHLVVFQASTDLMLVIALSCTIVGLRKS